MDNRLTYIVEDNQENVKLFDYMTKQLDLSVRFTKTASKEKRIQVNGKKVTLDCRLYPKDQLVIEMRKDETQNILPEAIELQIVYEDADILIVNKPPFMLVHPSDNFPKGSLTAAVLYHFVNKGETSIVRLVSRLDRDTSGLILIAKNAYAHMQLARANEEKQINKTYMAIVHGVLSPTSGTINLPIGKSDTEEHRRLVRMDGQSSITHYKTIQTMEKASILELQLETGRTHQIRVHLSHLKAPIIGDILYGSEEVKLINRQALHAKKLSFPHPRTQKMIEIDSELPADMLNLLKHLKSIE